MKKNIIIVNYNTQEFVDKLIRSINHFVDDAIIYVFDNSDTQPFKNCFDNVNIIDNTNGSIIDFNLFLSKYPNKNLSSGRLNNWASAKHCYTIEKCIEMFDENFILLDSDIILKKDISELFDDSYIYIAEESTQGNGIKRVTPYLCFINVVMCKNNNIHYFDERYMHGLRFTHSSDEYDTGAGFFINANKLSHKNIKCTDYIVHYGHGSWVQKGYKHELTKEEFFEKYKNCWDY